MGFTEEQVAEHVYVVGGPEGGRFPRTLSLLVRDQVCALIDAGCGAAALRAIAQAHRPDLVIYTHAHPDHCAGAGLFPGEMVWGPRESATYAGRLARMAERFVAPPLRAEWMEFMRERVGFVEFEPGQRFAPGQRWHLGETVVEAWHAPGHTPDHYCMYLPRQRLLLSTDIDLTSFGPWYGNPESEIDPFVDAIARARALPLRALVSSHKGVVRDGITARLDAFAAHFAAREARILDFLDRPRTLDDLVDAALIYRRYPFRPHILRYWEGEMVAKHLRRLAARGAVVEEGGAWRRLG